MKNTPLNALHEMGDITSDSVTQPLRGDDGYLISQPLVGLEVQGEARVVLLDDDACCLLDCFCPHTNLPLLLAYIYLFVVYKYYRFSYSVVCLFCIWRGHYY